MGIHYDYKSTKSAKLMEKQAKRERKLAERKKKKLAKEGYKKDENKDLELAAEDLRMATRHLGSIVGKVDVEEILGSIFKDFCIGK